MGGCAIAPHYLCKSETPMKIILFLLAVFLSACAPVFAPPTATPTLTPTATATFTATPEPTGVDVLGPELAEEVGGILKNLATQWTT